MRMVTDKRGGTGASGRMKSGSAMRPPTESKTMRSPRASRTCPTPAVLSMLLLQALNGNALCQAQEKANVLPETQAGRQIMLELQELGPIERDRKIRTTNLDVLFRIRRFDIPDFKFYGGFTVSHSRGAITRRTGSFEAGTPMDGGLGSPATGAGPLPALRTQVVPTPDHSSPFVRDPG